MVFDQFRGLFLLYFLITFPLLSMADKDNQQNLINSDSSYVIVESAIPEVIDISLFEQTCYEQDFFESKKGRGLFYNFRTEIINTVYKGYFTKESYFRRLHRYIPDNLDVSIDRQIDYFFVHGTFASNNPEYYDENDSTYRELLEYLAYLGDKYGVIVNGYSYRWSGGNTDDARMEASEDLARILNGLPLQHGLGGLGHSNGGNILLGTANRLISKEFIEVVAIATPTFEKKRYDYAFHRVKNAILFLSRADWVRDIAHLYAEYTGNTCDKYSFCKRREKEKPFDEQEKVYIPCDKGVTHIWVTNDDSAPNHCGLSALLAPQLTTIMKVLYRDFIYNEKIRDIIQNMALNIIAKDRQKRDRINLSLYERTPEEKILYKKLPKNILDLSEDNRKKHKELYGSNKNSMTVVYKFLKGGYNVLKDVGIC